MSHTLIYDIGKTNKKVFVFDKNFEVVWHEQSIFEEIVDEDGFACDDIHAIVDWVKDSWDNINKNSDFDISKINVSTYGASFVHTDIYGNILTPIYNYLKPVDKGFFEELYNTYGGKESFARQTSSPTMNFLNSGLQLYWLKKTKQNIFSKIKYSFHFPNYIAYLFHNKPCSEYTSIGCHTALFDIDKNVYHDWVKNDSFQEKLPPIVSGVHHFKHTESDISVGTGLHDSSSALIPYLIAVKEKFLLISTGTWSICLNPFNIEPLTDDELKQDCLLFMQTDGKPVKASRLFLGHELQKQLTILNKHFDKSPDHFKSISFDSKIFKTIKTQGKKVFYFDEINDIDIRNSSISEIFDFTTAYHQLIFELVILQVRAIKLAIGNTSNIKTIFIDGGFAKNKLFTNMLSALLPKYHFKTTKLAAGSALGAAIVMNKDRFTSDRFNQILEVKNV